MKHFFYEGGYSIFLRVWVAIGFDIDEWCIREDGYVVVMCAGRWEAVWWLKYHGKLLEEFIYFGVWCEWW